MKKLFAFLSLTFASVAFGATAVLVDSTTFNIIQPATTLKIPSGMTLTALSGSTVDFSAATATFPASAAFSTQVTTPKIVYSGSIFELSGSGSPEAVVTAAVGSVYHRSNGGSGTTLYVKESGSGNTGWVAVASTPPGGSTTQIQYNNAGALGGVTNATTDGTTLTLTSPKLITALNDTNGNELFKVTATSSAVNEFTIANAATGNGPVLSATGGDSNINIRLLAKGSGVVQVGDATTNVYFDLRSGAGNQGLLTFYDNSSAKWQVGKQSDNSFIFYDNAGTANAFSVTTGASSGQVYIEKTTASTSTSSGALRVGGGVGVAENVNAGGNFVTQTAGKTLAVKSGSNAKAGTFTLSSGAATVSNTSVTANSVVVMSLKTASGTITAAPYLTAITASTSFVVAAAATDNSTYNYVILEVN